MARRTAASLRRNAKITGMTVWLTVQGAAEYLKVSEPIIRDAVKRGDLPAYSIGKGREYRLTAEDIDSWMLSKSWEPRSDYKNLD